MKKLTLLFLILTSLGYAQVENDTLKLEPIEDTKTLFSEGDSIVLKQVDSLITLKINKEAALIDSLWLTELINSPLYDTIQYVLRDDEKLVTELEELPTELLKKRLKVLDSKTPFHIEYNSQLESIIKTYLKRRKSSFSGLLEKARYYFPMFEEQLDKYDIPLEIKYLAIVESALKPRAKSRVGATGLWQFMYPTGKMFDLKVSSYVDERQDPYKATEAACKYLASLYKIFGDWDLALAAYNSGPGNVSKAIRRSNGSKNYWNIRHNLPRETAGYVPAFYATLYIFEYAKEHNIVARKSALPLFKTDTVQVKRQMTFEQINETLDVDIELLQFLNPQYKLDIIPYVEGRNYTLSLPVESIGNFLSNEEEIYAFVEKQEEKREKPLPKYTELNDRIRYKVRSGDFLGKIANRYGVSVSNLKRWNNMRSTRLRIGQYLTVYPRRMNGVSVSSSKSTVKKPTSTKKKPLPTGPHQIYTVKSGESLWVIAQKFPNVSVQDIKDWNDNWSVKGLKPGTKLKIFSK
ncbi:LysM peptidoglycan-binding domain-containing protein [Lutibacter sp. TH_r2]|uniref:lytic transglycosylase domain-containing protein n=1 Tax=Lutibacter sp. TH_r2 TaxID=3082083 RepID=UPI0029542183|nr:LysM peptidoglycan-binding domain-containing protein [Lutibacter sp. TH_r2]MDV7186627.1 LysM peptidoglycan-binding domain-containing protein [Lutibacter sp. TH_r2]